MSDIDEGEREGDRAHDGTTHDLRRALLAQEIPPPPYVWRLLDLLDGQTAAIRSLEDRLETYMRRSAPAISAARMHVPIGGGGSWSWRQQQKDQKERREQAKLKYKEFLANRTPEQIAADNRTLEELFLKSRENRISDEDQRKIGEVFKEIEPVKRVQRKRPSKKTTRRK